MLLTGLQAVLPRYLQGLFIQAALNYIGCKSEGQFVCRSGDCWCECSLEFPQCNCPRFDLDTLEKNLLRIRDAWRTLNREFEESGGSGSFLSSFQFCLMLSQLAGGCKVLNSPVLQNYSEPTGRS